MNKLLKKIISIFTGKACYYLTNGTSLLPEKLTPEEEDVLLEKVEQGEKLAKQELIEKNLRLVVYIAQRFENTGISVDDLTSIGTIGLIKATTSFNREKNIKFATFASRCIENEILMHLRKTSKTKSELSLDEPLSTDKDGNELVLKDILGTDGDNTFKSVEQKMEILCLTKLIENLSNRERVIMKLRYGLNKLGKELTQKEVATKLNISQSYISRIEKKVLERLKEDIVSYS